MKKYINSFSLILVIGLSGCMSTNSTMLSNNILRVDVSQINSNADFQNKMIEIAKRSEMKFNEYTELLTALKKNRTLKNSRIPRNLGKRLSFSFDGYSLELVKKISDQVGYNLVLADLRVADSKVISRDYQNSMAVDILEDVSTDGGFNLEIDEAKMEIVARSN
jgi:hypothetical protein